MIRYFTVVACALLALTRAGTAEELKVGITSEMQSVTVETADGDDVLADLIAQQDLLQGPEAFEILYELMRGVGLGSGDSPQELKESAAKDFANMVAAYYQPDRDALVMLGESENPLSKILPRDFLIAHELVHSWRDQTSDLVEALRRGQPTIEETRIRLCMSEGEAQLAALAELRVSAHGSRVTPAGAARLEAQVTL